MTGYELASKIKPSPTEVAALSSGPYDITSPITVQEGHRRGLRGPALGGVTKGSTRILLISASPFAPDTRDPDLNHALSFVTTADQWQSDMPSA
jgi:hypothetical protein